MSFSLHPRLAADTFGIARLPLCRLLLMNDSRYPWLILVPEREHAREIHDLGPDDRGRLIEEVALVSEGLTHLFEPEKVNVGALGNVVPQLHVHVVARFPHDPAWPGPVWGSGAAAPYGETELSALRERLYGVFGPPDLAAP